MTRAPTGPTTELTPVIGEFAEGAATIAEGVHAIIAAVEAVVGALPAGIAALVHARVAELTHLLDEALAQIDRVLACTGDPDALRRTGTAWATGVGGPVSGLSSVTTLATMQADDQWHGVAATAYRNALAPQSAALAAVKAACDRINEVLQELATAIATFWLTSRTALITLIAALIAAVPVASTGVGAPTAVAWAVAALVAFVTAIVAEIAALTAVATTVAKDVAALQNATSNDTAFPRGAWPVSTTRLDDASLRDGDDTDWKVGP